MPYLERNGVRLHYEDNGPSGEEAAPVLITHGYASSTRAWTGQAQSLGKRYRIITWDMRGHADSDSPGDQAQYSEAETVADMAAILDHLGIEKAVISGLSLGGALGVRALRVRLER